MVTVAPLKAPSDEGDGCNLTKESDKTLEPTQAPPTFEEGRQATQDELLTMNLCLDEEPHPTTSGEHVPRRKKRY